MSVGRNRKAKREARAKGKAGSSPDRIEKGSIPTGIARTRGGNMNGKIAVLCLVSLLTLISHADAGALDVLNTVQNIAGAINDTQRTLEGKPGAPVVVGEAGKHIGGGHVVSHARKHK